MAKLVVVCERSTHHSRFQIEHALEATCATISPSHVQWNPPVLGGIDGVGWGVSNPTGTVSHSPTHVLVGNLLGDDPEYASTGSPRPDGSFALVRFDSQSVELVSDVVASRTIWYYADDRVLIASTSQRAIVSLLGTFCFNESVVPWYVSSGSLGPSASWDRRLRRLPPASVLRLSRDDWTVSVTTEKLEFSPEPAPEADHVRWLREAISSSVSSLNLHWSRWMLPLSGGGDSRVLLQELAHVGALEQGLRTVTWGAALSRNREGNDARVAQVLADRFGVENLYLSNDSTVDPEVAIERFIKAGDARVDHVAAYTDGMSTWVTLFQQGVEGTIRGDQAFGLPEVADELDARLRARLVLFDDIGNLRPFRGMDWPTQEIPLEFERVEYETLEQWRDRLSLQFRVPTFLAALADIKLAYSEQANPFLSESVVRQVLKTPDGLRSGKRLFKLIAADVAPEIPFAVQGANATPEKWLAKPEMADLVMDGLGTASSQGMVPSGFAAALKARASRQESVTAGLRQRVRRRVRRLLPLSSIAKLRSRGALPVVSWPLLSLRVHLMSQTRNVLEEDALRGPALWRR